jgi:protein TonB
MFEDSTFESAGRIHARSRRWMIAAFIFNAAILLALILIPLICPEALPHQAIAFLMEAPEPPLAAKPPREEPVRATQTATEMQGGQIFAPRRIPPGILIPASPEPALDPDAENWASNSATPGGDLFGRRAGGPVVHLDVKAPLRVSSAVEAGRLIRRTVPAYPAIAKAAGVSGTVTLAATISRAGTIENLRITSGPAMLRQAALEAVQAWRYQPYLLDGQPVEVETTVNVIFTLER